MKTPHLDSRLKLAEEYKKNNPHVNLPHISSEISECKKIKKKLKKLKRIKKHWPR